MTATIFALSSGRPPAAIAIVRVSGPAAHEAGTILAGRLPPARHAALRVLRDPAGVTLDHALVLFFPGPATSTGEDLLELHLHGGRAVVTAVERVLHDLPGCRRAEPGEFTRRALTNGRIDLAQAEGLADLLEAETESQRRAALTMSEGALSRAVAGWLDRVSLIAARIEAEIDFGDEDDVASAPAFDRGAAIGVLAGEMTAMLARPSVERLRDGLVVVIAGPRNAGKSSLFNALLGRDAAIVTAIAGTTRDVLEAGVVRDGIPYRLVDTAGLVDDTADPIEAIGIARARDLMPHADMILWLGDPADAPKDATIIHAKSDLDPVTQRGGIATSVADPASIDRLWAILAAQAGRLIGSGDGMHLRHRHRVLVEDALIELSAAGAADDLLLIAEHLRIANRCLAAILGRDATEAMLDALFGRFCLGK